MKKILNVLLSLVVLVCLLTVTTITANAEESAPQSSSGETASQSGIEATLTTDKEAYSSDEDIRIVVNVKNTNAYDMNDMIIALELPDGLTLKSGDLSISDIDIAGGETFSTEFIAIKGTSAPPSDVPTGAPETGSGSNVLLGIALIAITAVGIFIAAKSGKKATKFLCLFLCLAMVCSIVPTGVFAAESEEDTITNAAISKLNKTITVDGTEYEIKATIAYSENADMEIVITNEGFDEIDSRLVTQDESIVITGVVNSVNSVKRVFAKYESYYDEPEDVNVTGTTSWSTEIPLDIGTNTVTISAVDCFGVPVQKVVYVNRTNEIIEYSDNVKVADEEDYQELAEEMIACWVDENGTEDDDYIVVLIPDNCLLMSQIEDGLLVPGNVYMIPENDLFVTGFMGVYVSHQAPRGTENYPLDIYPDEGFEELIFTYPGMEDIFIGDISLDFSNGIDPNDPIDFALFADGTPMDVSQADSNAISTTAFDSGLQLLGDEMIENPLYPREGWQPEELLKNAFPSLKCSFDQYNRFNILLNWKDIVLYDDDGVKNEGAVDTGTIKLSGEYGISNLKYTGGMEWHPDLTPWRFDVLPQQLISKLTYDLGGNVSLKYDASISTSELVKLLNSGFENKAEFWGLKISGVDSLKTKWVMGCIGLNLIPPSYTLSKTIKGKVAKSTLSPSLVIMLFMDLDGEITAEGSVTFEYSSKVVKGFNIQKNGYTGSYGSQNQNRSDKHYNLGFDRAIDVYDTNEASYSLKLSGKVDASLDVGIGVGGGLMIGGFCPAMIDGEFFYRAKGLAEGEFEFLPDFSVDGYASIYQGLGVQSDLAAKILVKTSFGSPGFDLSKHWEYMFWEDTLATGYLDGTVYVADFDGDNSNNEKLPEAKITLTKNDTHQSWETYTDEEGYYKFKSLPDGQYTMVVEKDGYDTYVNANLIYLQKLTHDVYINKHSEWNGICSLSGKITIADEDTDMTNNLPLEGALVKIVSEENGSSKSTQTIADGTYSIDKIPAGNYKIFITREGYVPAFEFITVADNIPNYFNATIEAISEDFDGEGYASGAIIDAFDGHKVPGLSLEIYKGINNIVGPLERICETVSDENGEYITPALPAGNYTVRIRDKRELDDEKLRYKENSFTIKVLGNRTISNQNGTVTNGLGVGQIRIVLQWGQYPEDLDSHLVGHTNDGDSFHIYFGNMSYSDDSTTVSLDLDDVTSYGPETTTIYESSPGVFTYLVHDYTNKDEAYSSKLANSGAYVEIYIGTSTVAAYTFNVPNFDGTVWTVFQYDSDTGAIKPINTMDYESYPPEVGIIYANSTSALYELQILAK